MKNLLMVLICASALLLALMACAGETGDSPPQTTVPIQDENVIMERLEGLAKENAALRAELEDLKNQADKEKSDLTPQLTSLPAATPDPDARAIPSTPTGPGICGRTPEVQQAIIDRLMVPYCQPITNAELYRLRDLGEIRAPSLLAGDFDGLVNLYELEISLRQDCGGNCPNPPVIPSGAFSGIRVEILQISDGPDSDTHVSIAEGAFEGADVKSLEIHLHQEGELSDLPESVTQLAVYGDLSRLDWQIFRFVPELERLSLGHRDKRRSSNSAPESRPRQIYIPDGAFDANPHLKGFSLSVDTSYGSEDRFRFDKSLLADHTGLASVEMANFTLQVTKGDGFPLELHPESPLARELIRVGTQEWENWENGQPLRLPR